MRAIPATSTSFIPSLTVAFLMNVCCGASLIIDHTCTDIWSVPTNWITQARQQLHIAYGHTSHGFQVTYGMNGLIDFMNGHGYPLNLFAWWPGGGGWLDLRDTPFTGAYDLGDPDRTAWEPATREYLTNHPECNVVMWGWCGQVSTATEGDIDTYLNLMDGLRQDYTNVTFVHMTGHLDGTGKIGNLNLRNLQIRSHCSTNNEVLYDFADIESHAPDGRTNYMALYANENCDFDSTGDGVPDRNWAVDWQNLHTEGVEWFPCIAPHSQPLNGNRKAYAAWWLWARLAGWSGFSELMTRLWIRSDERGQPIFTCFRREGSGAGLNLQSSPDLISWSTVPPELLSNQVSPSTNGLYRVDMRFTAEGPPSPAFFRLLLNPD